MPLVSAQELQKLQQNQNNIRNVCIVAHVDHGKTTIADCLISTNGIISQRSAGKLRYMDNTAYEQARGITVKSSCISLQHITKNLPGVSSVDSEKTKESDRTFLINLIDSPGHMDFSGEVSSALRMTDGCYLVVDAIEGVCIQTRTVLRQAWLEKVRPILVINKIDKLFSQLQLSPDEAYRQLVRVVEQVNLVLGELWIEQQIVDADSAHAARLRSGKSGHSGVEDDGSEEEDVTIDVDASNSNTDDNGIESLHKGIDGVEGDGEFEFSPEKGNVIFASAYHGWGFTIENFVELYAAKLKMNRRILRQTLWGEFYFNPKTRKIATRRPNANAQTMFSSLVLSNIHQIYTAILGTADDMANANSHKGYSSLTHRDLTKLERIDKALGLNVPAREFKHEDVNGAISAFMGRWLPISTSLLDAALSLPSPVQAQPERIPIMWHPSTHDLSPSGIEHQTMIQTALTSADRSQNAPIIAYVSKVFAVPNEQFARNTKIKLLPGHKTLIAMTRLFSGTLKVGDEINILGARFNPAHPEKHVVKAKIPQLWMLMGPDLQPINEVQAGAVFGIGGEDFSLHIDSESSPSVSSSAEISVDLKASSGETSQPKDEKATKPKQEPKLISSEDRNAFVSHIVKTATLTNTDGCPVFGALNRHVNPIVRVAVEPESPSDLASLEAGMWLLHQADAAVHVEVQENGEFIIGALGELHLSRCLELLRDEFARVPVKVSKPIVSFRETVLPGLAIDPNTKAPVSTELVVERSSERQVTIVMRAVRLPENITTWLEAHGEETRIVHKLREGIQQQQQQTPGSSAPETSIGADIIAKWSDSLKQEFKNCESDFWKQQADFVWSLGPHRIGPNILLNHIPLFATSPYWRSMLDTSSTGLVPCISNPAQSSNDSSGNADNSSTSGTNVKGTNYAKETMTWFGMLQQLDSAIRSGFQLATRAGPLCEEPLMGVAVQILDVNVSFAPHAVEDVPAVSPQAYLLPDPSGSAIANDAIDVKRELGVEGRTSSSNGSNEVQTPSLVLPPPSKDASATLEEHLSILFNLTPNLTGAVISAIRNGVRRSFQRRPQRLYEALYLAHVQVTAVNMGKAYTVLNRRRGYIISDEVNESSGLTLVVAHVPAAEAFGFSEELVDKSGGAANAQLTFAKWHELEVDPNFVPTTEEELEEFGENIGGIAPNLARKYVDGVRKRKGLAVNEKLVDGANKQRTLSKKK